MRTEIVPCLTDNYAYLLVSEGGVAVVVDPSEAEPVLATVESQGLSLVGIWLTHHHHDHVGGVEELLAAQPKLTVVASDHDREHRRIRAATRGLLEGDPLWFASQRVRVLSVPGHTLGAVAFLVDGALFSGDTLFSSGCGRLFEGTPEMMLRSLDKLRSLPPETRLYPGHEYAAKNLAFAADIEPDNPAIAARRAEVEALRAQGLASVPTTLGDELLVNPFLRWDVPEVIARAKVLGAASEEPVDVFAALRRARDVF